MKALFQSVSRCAIVVLTIGGCLLAAPLIAKEGDLDPAFGDVGRVGPIASAPGTAWSIYPMDDDSLVIGGGKVDLSCPSDISGCVLPRYVGLAAKSFLIRVSNAGLLLENHEVAAPDFHLFAIARQFDGKFLAVGRRLNERSLGSQFVVYRLNPDGSLDAGFGANGLVQMPAEKRGEVDEATAVVVEPNGRIVVAGSTIRSGNRSEFLIRLLANGDIDDAFGSSGIVVLSDRESSLDFALRTAERIRMQILRTGSGAYRVTARNWCQVVGVTPNGTLDPAFGTSGIAQIQHPISNGCSLTLAMQNDGRLVVGASDGEAAVVTRLLANGQHDPSFLAGTSFQDSVGHFITALAVRPTGSIVVALGISDFGYHGLSIKQLLPSGELDESFGNAGSVRIDMPSEFGSVSLLFDMLVRDDGTIIGAGGNPFAQPSHGPIIVQLLGAAAADGPGVLSVVQDSWLSVDEEHTEVSVEVRRAGGNAGQASVAYQVFADDDASAATVGEDFAADVGRLEWEDGDATNRQIRVQVLDDDVPEYAERVKVVLADAAGGVGLGKAGQIVVIQASDGATSEVPQIGFVSDMETIGEADGLITLNISRSSPADRAVTVRYATTSGSASEGADFTGASGTLAWEANETEFKTIVVDITNDNLDEGNENFTVTLSDPTSGVSLAPNAIATVHITDDEAGAGGGGGGTGGGGGGAFALLGLGALLALLMTHHGLR